MMRYILDYKYTSLLPARGKADSPRKEQSISYVKNNS